MSKTEVETKLGAKDMRLEDIPRERIPWKEMKVGGIYQRKDGRYYIFAGRSDVYHKTGESLTRVAEQKFYTYIYIDYPNVLTFNNTDESLRILASSARIYSSEYRQIARTLVGMMPSPYNGQSTWTVEDFVIQTDPKHISRGSTRFKTKVTLKEAEMLKALKQDSGGKKAKSPGQTRRKSTKSKSST